MHHREDHAMFELRQDPKAVGGKALAITRPSDVLPVHDREELQLQLDHYSGPFISLQLPDTVAARKHYLLYIRPALRYYCEKFSVTQPSWLVTDKYFQDLPDAEKERLFGTTQLRFNGSFRAVTKQATRGKVIR